MNELENRRVHLIFEDFDLPAAMESLGGRTPESIIADLKEAGLKGRGGAGFPTGMKWEGVAQRDDPVKIVICNADEGEPGTFKDREILQKRPEKIFFGMAACAAATGAKKGFVYLRGEYAYLLPRLGEAMAEFESLLDASGMDFPVEIRSGSGAYVCGEETSLIESIEGKRGEARNKPPYPVEYGYEGHPTAVNNVETFVYAAVILTKGPAEFAGMGTTASRGAKVFCVSGDTPIPGIYELELGMRLSEFVGMFGDGDTKAVQVGGSSGYCVPRKAFRDTILGFEGVPTGGSMMLFNSGRSMYNILRNYLEFFCEESCGQCTPCRVGCQQLLKGIESVKRGVKPAAYLKRLREVAETMAIASKCGLGQSVPHPFISITEEFGEEIAY